MEQKQRLTRNENGALIHKKIRTRLWLYFGISVVLLGVTIYQIVKNDTRVGLPAAGLGIGILGGIFFSRINKISWDHGAKQVISQMDTLGIILLIIYIPFEIFREHIVGYFVHGPALFAVSFAVLAGVMYGRVLGMRGKIKQIFKEQNIRH